VTAAIAAFSGGAALVVASTAVRAASVVAGLLGAVCAVFAARGEERTTRGEVMAAVALASLALPVALSCGASLHASIAVATTWAIASGVHTGAVRGVLARSRAQGTARLAASTTVVAIACSGTAFALATRGWIAPIAAAAVGVPTCASLALGLAPPSPRNIRRVGWTLMGSSAAVTVLSIIGTR
jgi:hypothetical protein